MNQGKYVFSQVMEYFPRWVFEKAVDKYNGDFHAKSLNSYSHCLHLMFSQLAGCKSLKDISLVLKSLKKSVYHLGITTAVDSSLVQGKRSQGLQGLRRSWHVAHKESPSDVCKGERSRCVPSRLGDLRNRLDNDTL